MSQIAGNSIRRITHETDHNVGKALTILIEREFVLETDHDDQFVFPHEVVRTIVYNMLAPDDAILQHSQVAYFIETNFLDLRPHFESLTWHYVQCYQYSRAMIYTIHATRHYVHQGLVGEAIRVADAMLKYPLSVTDVRDLRNAVADLISREHRHLARLLDSIARRSATKLSGSSIGTHVAVRQRSSLTTTNTLYSLHVRLGLRLNRFEENSSHMIECKTPNGCIGGATCDIL